MAEIEAAQGLSEELGIRIPIAITYCASAKSLCYRGLLVALKSVLRFVLHEGETVILVPVRSRHQKYVWLKVLRDFEAGRPVLTIMMVDEGQSNLIDLNQ